MAADDVLNIRAGLEARPSSADAPIEPRAANDPGGPVLLGRPRYGGTVAAIRDLAKDGIPVSVMSEGVLDCSRWSRHVERRISSGPQADPRALLESLDAARAGKAHYLLLPVCDTSAWTYSAHAAGLGRDFLLYAPPIETMNRILDKPALDAACDEVGLARLRSWIVDDATDLAALAPTLPFPVIIKPRTHVRRLRSDKGTVVRRASELVPAWDRLSRRETLFDTEDDAPDRPILFLQQFVSTHEQGVLSVSGFIDRSGRHFVARAARKVLQRSEPAGVGVCFEAVPLETEMGERVAALCHVLGYFGVFEVEFVRDGDDWAVIDFNPRFYNQMALDIARGVPLARLCYYDAIGDQARLAELVESAVNAPVAGDQLCLRDGFTMALILIARRLTGKLSRADWSHWLHWQRARRDCMVDPMRSDDDPWVWPVHMISEVRLGLRKLAARTGGRRGSHG